MKRPIKNFSVSQVETFGTPDEPGCPRKHFFSWILGKKPPATEAQERGTYVHKSIAEFITEKKPPPPEHEIYLRALDGYFPQYDYSVEHKLILPTHVGIPWIGFIDLICEDPGETKLIDWKTTSDMRYAKTPAELRTNLQLNVYAHYAYELGVKDAVRAGLVYIEVPKKSPKRQAKVLPVFIDISREQAASVWEGTKPVLDQMIEVAELDDPREVPCNTTICGKYGGCPFRTECGISMFSNIASSGSHTPKKNKEIASMSFLDKLKNKNGQTAAPTPAPTSTPKAAPAAETKPATTPTPKAKGGFLARGAALKPGQIVPDDAPPRDSGGADPLPEPEVEAQGGDGEEQTAEQPKRGRGRPPKGTSENKQKVKEFVIYMDCMVTKGAGDVDPTSLEDFWATIDMELNEAAVAAGKDSWWEFGFAEQKAAIALKVRERVEKGLPPAMIVRKASTFLNSDVLPLLIPHATQIVQRI